MKQKKSESSSLRHRLQLQEEIETPDGAGGYTRSWNNVAQLWAQMLPLRGNEKLFVNKLQAETTHKIRVRYRSDITSRHRFTFGTRVFSIYSIRNIDELDNMLEIMAVEGDQ